MYVSVRVTCESRGERGAIVVMVALWLPVLLLCMTFVVDVGNWWVHKRHLQMQADSAALAAAGDFTFPCADGPILQKAADYSGDLYNAQIGGTPSSRVHRLINSKTFYNQPSSPAPDDTVTGTPCAASAIDVKLTETDLPWYFKPMASLLGGRSPVVPFINAHARISVNQVDTTAGALPVGVPDVNPKSAHAWFIDEDSGVVLKETALTKVGTSNGLVVWDNAGTPLPVKFDSTNVNVGVVVALGGLSSTTCGQILVQCYDAEAPTAAGGLPTRGIVKVRGYSEAGTGAQPGNPILRDVALVPGTCADPYFSSATTSCTFGVSARVAFGAVAVADSGVTATVGGSTLDLTYNAASGRWTSPTTLTMPAGTGPVAVGLDWTETKGTWNSNTCKVGGGNKCKDTFGTTVHRGFSASDARSGPIKVAQVSENGMQWTNSVERCSSVQTSCTHNMVVRIGVAGSLGNAQDRNDPIVALRVVGGSQNQSLDCDPAQSNLKAELAGGCAPTYGRNTGTACPGSVGTLWASPQPWQCVALQTGAATNQVPAGMNLRIMGSEKPASCTAPNHWSSFPNLSPSDPRIIQVFLTPFGAFSGSGSNTVPVTDFATFYVTGWTGQGQGFNNPCQGNGDDPVPNNDAGYIVGHFIKYIQTLNTGGGTTACDLGAFGSCVAVMTR
jgi:Flp pilus assembly protein TadG